MRAHAVPSRSSARTARSRSRAACRVVLHRSVGELHRGRHLGDRVPAAVVHANGDALLRGKFVDGGAYVEVPGIRRLRGRATQASVRVAPHASATDARSVTRARPPFVPNRSDSRCLRAVSIASRLSRTPPALLLPHRRRTTTARDTTGRIRPGTEPRTLPERYPTCCRPLVDITPQPGKRLGSIRPGRSGTRSPHAPRRGRARQCPLRGSIRPEST